MDIVLVSLLKLISHIFLLFPLLNLNRLMPAGVSVILNVMLITTEEFMGVFTINSYFNPQFNCIPKILVVFVMTPLSKQVQL